MQSSKYINKHLLNESENVLLSRLNDYKYVPKRIIWSQSPKRTQKVPANTILLDPSFKNKEMDKISRVCGELNIRMKKRVNQKIKTNLKYFVSRLRSSNKNANTINYHNAVTK